MFLIFYSEMKIYIVIHFVYLCDKPDSVDFPWKKHQFFYTKPYFKSQTSAYFRYFSSYKQMVFSAIGARFRRIFIRIFAILPGFSIFQRKASNFFDINTYFQSQISAYFRFSFVLQADVFLSNGSSIQSHFHANN